MPSRRSFRKLDVQFDQHVEIVLVAAEHRRLDDVEIADVSQGNDVLFRERPAFSVVWARALICGAICATRLRNSAISGRAPAGGTSFNWATDTIGLLRVFDWLKGQAGAVHAARLQFMQPGCRAAPRNSRSHPGRSAARSDRARSRSRLRR